jgi:hypothetical protein
MIQNEQDRNLLKRGFLDNYFGNRLDIRPPQKLACSDEMLGDLGARARGVLNIHEDPGTESTQQLVSQVEFPKWSITELPRDASFRTYYRISVAPNSSFILMDSPPNIYNLRPFIDIANFLNSQGFSAPQIYQQDEANGFLLLEDFGTTNITNYLSTQNAKEVYRLILDLLCELQTKSPPQGLTIYSKEQLLDELSVFIDWYPNYSLNRPIDEDSKLEFFVIWQEILNSLPEVNSCLVLRDFHVDNMMKLERPGIKSLGLLDFQDALIGSPIYDLVSVLEDARRDVPFEFASQLIDYFTAKSPHLSRSDIDLSYHIHGAQRNMRILGVFARKFQRDKSENYLKLIPRVKKYLNRDLAHPSLKKLKDWLDKSL